MLIKIKIGLGTNSIRNSYLVALVHSNWNQLCSELSRWKSVSREGDLLAYSTAAD